MFSPYDLEFIGFRTNSNNKETLSNGDNPLIRARK